MPRLTEQDKVLILSKLEEEWFIRRVATHNGLNKSTVLQEISKEEVGTRRARE
jgi:IS30 family transposase